VYIRGTRNRGTLNTSRAAQRHHLPASWGGVAPAAVVVVRWQLRRVSARRGELASPGRSLRCETSIIATTRSSKSAHPHAQRQTIRKRLQAKLNEVKAGLRRRMHFPVVETATWLRSVVGGHIRYYGVPTNRQALQLFWLQVGRLWHRVLSRRSQNARVSWDRMRRLIALVASRPHLSPVSIAKTWRHYLRQEPDAGKPLVRICGGGYGNVPTAV
jgi:hypothetical protein